MIYVCFVCFVSLWEFQTCFFSLRIHESGVKSPRVFFTPGDVCCCNWLEHEGYAGRFPGALGESWWDSCLKTMTECRFLDKLLSDLRYNKLCFGGSHKSITVWTSFDSYSSLPNDLWARKNLALFTGCVRLSAIGLIGSNPCDSQILKRIYSFYFFQEINSSESYWLYFPLGTMCR